MMAVYSLLAITHSTLYSVHDHRFWDLLSLAQAMPSTVPELTVEVCSLGMCMPLLTLHLDAMHSCSAAPPD